ncbi:MAG TPA: SDR family NAD(P)-dependent oxidoreductase [Solirubrobacteraceae bacterium]|nr:SDR family NAD(P)-dependent oxidoreductase [Solirubrobacteraceae bacterium]
MINSVLDEVLDRTVVAGFTNVGYGIRRHGWNGSELPRMAGKVALVTGSSSGLGLAAAEGFAHLGATVWLAVRNRERGQEACTRIVQRSGNPDVHMGICDLSQLESVRQFAGAFPNQASRLDVLVNNAGVMTASRTVSADGIELTLATNVVGPFLLTNLLIPLLRESAPARVINVSSGGMYTQGLRIEDLQSEHGEFDGPKVYARTKRAEVVLTELWAKQLAGTGVVVHAMHPGWSDTPGVRSSLPRFYRVTRPLLRTPAQGADTIVWLGAATEPARSSGRFWHDRRPRPTHRLPGTRETPQEREQLLAQCLRLSGWSEPAVSTPSTSNPERDS